MNKIVNINYSHILVLGLAKSGTAAAKLLIGCGKKVRVNDSSQQENYDIITELESLGAEIVLGSHPLSVLDNIDLIVKNPGIPYDNPIIVEAGNRAIPVITEIELAGKLVEGANPIIGITGSNGKTTTTTLITQMLKNSNQAARIAGNIGTVATDVAQVIEKDEKMILELSSFQLLGVQTFKPNIAVLLNVFEAHLDYHKTLENYQEAKFNVFVNQTVDDYLIYNLDDPIVVNAIKRAKSKLVPFSLKAQHIDGAWADETSIYFKDEKIMDKEAIVLVGNHNLENILAAVCAAKLCEASNEGIYDTLTTFIGVEHRLELVDQINQRLFYNDSKATNILATQKALSSFQQPIILLAGGLDRGNEFDDLIPYLKHVKAMVLFGQTAQKLEKLARKVGIAEIIFVDDISEGVDRAYALSIPGDVILLSPACASWDQYRTFEERGNMFVNTVHRLV